MSVLELAALLTERLLVGLTYFAHPFTFGITCLASEAFNNTIPPQFPAHDFLSSLFTFHTLQVPDIIMKIELVLCENN